MDCKHENLDPIAKDNYSVQFHCHNCEHWFTDDEVVILTKAQYDLTQAVVEAGRKFRILEIEKGDAWDTDAIKSMGENATQVDKARLKLDEALDALDKGE